jgi:hypothetical protein
MQINSIHYLHLVVENRRDKEYNNCNYLEHPVRSQYRQLSKQWQ